MDPPERLHPGVQCGVWPGSMCSFLMFLFYYFFFPFPPFFFFVGQDMKLVLDRWHTYRLQALPVRFSVVAVKAHRPNVVSWCTCQLGKVKKQTQGTRLLLTFSHADEEPCVNLPKGGWEKESANKIGGDKKAGEEKESGEFLHSGVMWSFPVTVIYEEQKYYNIPAANQRNGSKRGLGIGGLI